MLADVRNLNQWAVGLILLAFVGGVQPTWAENTDLSSGLDARGTDHTSHDHAGQVLTAVDLSAEPATGASALLDEADFTNADLSLADLSQVSALKLVGPGLVLDGARLSGGQWDESDLSGADLSFVSGTGVSFSDATLIGATLEFSNLRSSSFVRADLSSVQAQDASWVKSDFTGASLVEAELAGLGLRDSVLIGADLSGARLFLADLSRVDARCEDALTGTPVGFASCPRFDGVDLSFATLVDAQVSFGRMIPRAGIAVNLEESDLTRADFSDACFTALQDGLCQPEDLVVATNLIGTDLDGVIFDRAYLGGANLSFARGDCVAPQDSPSGELTQCPSFVGTDARSARLLQTRLVSPVATGWILHGADLTSASLTGLKEPCDLPEVAGESPACLEFFAQGAEPGALAILRKTNLSNADIAGVNFAGLDLEGARLDGVDAYRVRTVTDEAGDSFDVVYQTSFSGANLAGASLVGADLELADLSNVDLTSADLSNATITGALLAGVSAANAVFDAVVLSCETAPCQAVSGFSDLVGSSWVGGDLGGQDFSDLDLTGIDLRNANIQGTLWSGSILTRADFSGQNLSGVDLSQVSQIAGARFEGASLTCASDETCDPLASATDLTGVGFQGATLDGVSFRNRELAGADFSLADLRGADLAGATATEANFSAASVAGINLGGVNLAGARFDSTDFGCSSDSPCAPFAGVLSLAGARFRAAGLEYVRFEGDSVPLDLTEADLSQANLTGAQFLNVDALGARFDLLAGVCGGDGSCADFSGATLSDGVRPASFVQAQLSGVSFVAKDLREVDLSGALLIGASLVESNLSGAGLAAASLRSADLTSVNFAGANLRAADFSFATFASSGTLAPISGGVGCTPGAGASAVDLRGAQLSQADFGSAVDFFAGCIEVDETTTYDSETTVFPEGFTLASEMTDLAESSDEPTNVPEPSWSLSQAAALVTLVILFRKRRKTRSPLSG
ncbi:MAG: hypothetical protein CBC48_15375 [bacterium TMED88]|nr:hypothetical protein [Deltaproteobacteria bacterium]OUV26554.1 MAG: hypothetical protein CBC48_15375 [bacterium TMED88]